MAAWDEFVAVYGPLVFRVARQVREWLERPDRGRFRAWLLRIARNIADNLLTRKPFGTTGRGGDDALHGMTEIPERMDDLFWKALGVRLVVARKEEIGTDRYRGGLRISISFSRKRRHERRSNSMPCGKARSGQERFAGLNANRVDPSSVRCRAILHH
ncbi:MAG: hypothetical protein U0935_18000 [Pirellulales bacterium]